MNLFLNEAVNLLEEGVGTVEDIDCGCKWGLNHPMGPLELIDLIGADSILQIMNTMYSEFGDPRYRASSLLKTMVHARQRGKKDGVGFYDYTGGDKRPRAFR